MSRWLVYLAERGQPVSVEAAARLGHALGLHLEVELVDPRRRTIALSRQTDLVHSAMGELEARHLRKMGSPVGLDEPYQHYQFAGRADVVSWNLEERALLHLENRTRFPDIQEMAGAFNSKKAYFGRVMADRVGLRAWASETHVVVALWSSEVLHALRLRAESFRAICPDPPTAFHDWWIGSPPSAGRTSALVVLDPLAVGRQRQFVGFNDAMTVRPRHRDYADVAQRLTHEG
ncbi:MAG: hypothetical protein WD830_10010 [Chloroflexota bacterium]